MCHLRKQAAEANYRENTRDKTIGASRKGIRTSVKKILKFLDINNNTMHNEIGYFFRESAAGQTWHNGNYR